MPAYEQTVRGEWVHEDIVPTCFEKGSATFCTLAPSRWTACSWTSRPPTPHWSMLHWSDRSWNTPSYLTSSVDQKTSRIEDTLISKAVRPSQDTLSRNCWERGQHSNL